MGWEETDFLLKKLRSSEVKNIVAICHRYVEDKCMKNCYHSKTEIR